MTDLPPEEDDIPRAAVGRYPRFSEAQERGLVAAALEVPYWVIREGRDFVLYVEASDGPRIAGELEKFEQEHAARRVELRTVEPPLPKLDTLPLFYVAWVMSTFWGVQNFLPSSWIDRGASTNGAIFHGEWWRTVTALTLHGDLAHFLANLFFVLLFGAFLQPRFGAGAGWLGVVLSGALGNAVNAFFYRSESHSTIGASTSVFGAIGLLMAWEVVARLRRPGMRGWWHLVVPLGGGLALLALFGSGDETQRIQSVDYMAHLWGFAAGTLLGLVVAGARAGERIGLRWQRICGLLALALPVLGWVFCRSMPG
jgi:membrane associated rhomboid family serine protease